MDPLTIAMMLAAAGKGAQGIASGAGQIDWMSPEQRNKMKELERNQALGLLGIDEASQQRILNQQLHPVQAAEREAFSRQAQQAQIADVGQGATFRGQQALLEGAAAARSEATQRAQQMIAEQDALDRAAQIAELRQLKAQRAANIEGVGTIAGAGLEAAAGVAGAQGMADLGKAREAGLLSAAAKASATPASPDFTKEVTAIIEEATQTDGMFPAGASMPQLTPARTASEAPAPPEMFNAMQMLGMLPAMNENVTPGMWGQTDKQGNYIPGEWTGEMIMSPNGLPVKVVMTKPGSMPKTYSYGEPGWDQIIKDILAAQGGI